ncbi:hypothetical protein D3C86_1981920 [compost metagenome]
MPSSMPWRNAATSWLRREGSSPMRQVPWPMTGTWTPASSRVRMHISFFRSMGTLRLAPEYRSGSMQNSIIPVYPAPL